MFKKLFLFCTALTLSVGLWADGCVFMYTASEKLGMQFSSFGTVSNHDFNSETGIGIVTYADEVTTIENYAFYECTALISITIPASVTTIGDYAFDNCSGLTSITCEATTPPTCGSYCFYDVNKSIPLYVPAGSVTAYQTVNQRKGFTNIQSIQQNNVITYTATNKLTTTTSTYSSGIHTNAFDVAITSHTFSDGIGTITFAGNITTIGDYAFIWSKGLTSITIPNSVTTIGMRAFDACSDLTSITIPNSVTTIGNQAFSSCSGLTSITIPNSVTSIGVQAFNYCRGLTSIYVDAANTHFVSVDGVLFNYAKDTLVQIPLGSTRTAYSIPNSVTTIGNWAFEGYSGLTSITIPNSVTTIGEGAFFDCKGLTSITIPNFVTTIGNHAFQHCSGLTSVTIGNSVTTIGDYAFCNCGSLTSITIPNSVITIGESAFDVCSGLTSVTIGNSVTTIGESAFVGCGGLTSITIPNSVTTIGSLAFCLCSGLTSIIIPNSVTTIGYQVFYDCEKLTDVTVSWTDANQLPDMGEDVFNYIAKQEDETSGPQYATLHVPAGTKAIYEAAEQWKDFGTIKEPAVPVPTTYINENGVEKNIDAYVVSNATKQVTWGAAGETTWYVVNGTDITLSAGAVCAGDVRLILADNAKLTASGVEIDFTYTPGIKVSGEGNSLTIYAQSIGKQMGQLIANGKSGETGSAGIGGGNNQPGSYITINGGVIMANGGIGSAGIGGGYMGSGSYITINGGIVTATSGGDAAGIGSGNYGNASSNIKVATDLVVKAGSSANPTTVITNTGADLASCLAGKQFATVATAPAVGDQFVDANSGLKFEVTTIGETNTVMVISNNYIGTSYEIPAWVTYKDVEFAVTEIGEFAFNGCSALTSINIPASVTMVGEGALSVCNKLAMVTFAEGSQITSIGIGAFAACVALTSITIPAGVTTIGTMAFQGDTTLAMVTFAEGSQLTTIGPSTFFDCKGLTSIAIPNSVTTIGYAAFGECSALTAINLPASVSMIGNNAFYHCTALTAINVDDANIHYASIDGVLFNYAKDTLVQYPIGSTRTEYTIPANVTTIGEFAFDECSALTSASIPASVTAIGSVAFRSCYALTDVTVNWTDANQLPDMGEDVFNHIAKQEDETSGPQYATLHVPSGTTVMYEAAAKWKDFGTIVEASPSTPTGLLDADNNSTSNIQNSKLILNGQLIIRKENKTYNTIGQEVR